MIRVLLPVALIAVIIEVLLFNHRHWESCFYVPVSSFDLTVGEGIENVEGGTYIVTDPEYAYIELKDINSKVKNLHLDIFPLSIPNGKNDVIEILIDITDDANAEYKRLPETEIVHGITGSLYKRLYLVGDSSKIRITLLDCAGKELNLGSIGINEKVPFEFHIIRFMLLLAVLGSTTLIILMKPILNETIDLSKRHHRAILIITALANIMALVLIYLIFINKLLYQEDWPADLQYGYLSKSIANGHTFLDFDAPTALLNMDNPYDPALRDIELAKTGESCIMDFSYYEGKYYCYYGIIPVLLFYLPYFLVTGRYLYTGVPIIIGAIVFCMTSFWFVLTWTKRHFSNISLGFTAFLPTFMTGTAGVLYCLQCQGIYTVPIMLSLAFGFLGITCLLNSVRYDGSVNRALIFIGALFLALIIGCRPQLAIISLLAIPFLWEKIKKSPIDIALFIAPFAAVSGIVMYYNYLRFGNPIDFGFKYILTSQDMLHRGFIFNRFYLGFYEYLFQPFNISAKFPYMFASADIGKLSTDFMGIVINEPFIAGFFLVTPIALELFSPYHYMHLKEKSILTPCLMCIAFAVINIGIDTQMAGITLRYMSDFSLFLIIPVVIMTMSVLNGIRGKEKEAYEKFVFFMGISSLVLNYYSLLVPERYCKAKDLAPGMYYGFKYLF